ncbi:ATP/GTP-binding protein [Dietzia aerolata]|uniref:Double-GTPase 2 domain-containing protein n=1 Tax=Dietzia aerolata TaxID=595984 RepID=A0ABV5JRW9_9ACTN|nr:ATP/GTP-binding protein [Dietzia aerolata]MBB0970403.1 ATP/GTP-binding protein [Dietzia aerolata]
MGRPKLEQHIAVFGESGSGKTVLLSSFYGAAQEPSNVKKNGFNIIALTSRQGTKLHGNYLGMRNKAELPEQDKHKWDSFRFAVKAQKTKEAAGGYLDALNLVWHDYPGEWWEGRRDDSASLRARQISSFKALLGSDVAMILIDGQKLLDNKGEESRYLKQLFTTFRNTLHGLRDEILDSGKKLDRFPRIWMLALSKSDLLPDVDVVGLRDIVVENAGEELELLRDVIGSFVTTPDALSVGDDYVLLSAGTFEPKKIDLSLSIGTDLLLPIAAILPFERHVKWVKALELPGKLAEVLLKSAGVLTTALLVNKKKLPGPIAAVVTLLGPSLINDAAEMAGTSLREANKVAREKGDVLGALLTSFKIDLEDAEKAGRLLRSIQ